MWNLNTQIKSLKGCYLLHRKLNYYEKNLNDNPRFTNWNCIFLGKKQSPQNTKWKLKLLSLSSTQVYRS